MWWFFLGEKNLYYLQKRYGSLYYIVGTYNRHVDFWLFLDFSSEDSSKRPTLESNKQISTEVSWGPYFPFYTLHIVQVFAKESVLWYAALEKKFFKYVRKKLSKKSLYIFHIALPKIQKQNHSPVWSSYLFAPYLCIIFNFSHHTVVLKCK